MIVTKLIKFYFNPFSLPTLSNVNASQQVFTFTVRPATHTFSHSHCQNLIEIDNGHQHCNFYFF